MAVENRVIKPQDGFQTKFLSSKADIVFAGSGAGCFAKDTLVKTVKGYKPIQDIEVGEYVLSYNENTKQKEYKLVCKTHTYEPKENSPLILLFIFKNGKTIECTENHKFYFKGAWVEAKELVWELVLRNETINTEEFEINISEIEEIQTLNNYENVYDLSVIDNNNYFITDNEILVHNCGKTYSLLMEPLRHITTVKGFGAVVFRRTTPQITNEGGLWDTSVGLYQTIAKQKESSREWIFNNGNKLKFSHLEYDKDAYSWQGSQIPFIGFDELTHFSKKQFFYLLSRNRSVCGVKPYVRATLNPDPDSWVAEFIEWYIDQKTGYPIKDHIGKLRYFMLNSGEICWGNTKQEVYEKQKYTIDTLIESNEGSSMEDYIKSFSFITGSIYENKELMRANPDYLSNLLAQSEEDQLRLLYGNWKHVTNDNELYNYEAFKSMFGSLKSSKTGVFSITADIAMEGADKFVVGVWDGYELVDIKIINKSDGSVVVDTIKEFANTYQVPNNRIVYDNDGVGSYLGGFIIYGIGFNNNGKPVLSSGKAYKNLKSQCYYVSSQNVNEYKVTISDKVANTRYDEKYTVKERFMYERRCIRKDKPDYDQKLAVIPKQEMKPLIGGDSPDLMDMFMLRARLELVPKF